MSRKISLFCLVLGLLDPFSNSFAGDIANTELQKLVHNWEYITFYSTLPDEKSCPEFSVGYGKHDVQGLRLDILGIMQGFEFFKTNVITAQLYRANGETVEPTAEGKEFLNSPISVATYGTSPPQVMTYFPWGTNALQECWIKVSMGPERYWLEIPYGFDRNPADPLPPSIPGGPPKFVSAMKSLTDHDHVMRWQNVHYDLGAIQNHWRLSLIQSNSFNAESEVVLYREDFHPSSWKTNSPTTTLSVLDSNGTVIGSHCIDVQIQDGGMERCNTYRIDQNGNGLRCWGQLEISVGDKTNRIIVPSSLYKYAHGHADTNAPVPLNFLTDIPSLKEVSLNISEANLLEILRQQKIDYTNGVFHGDSIYEVRPKKHVVVIFTFRQGYCGGIQRLPD
jgi:hypothetical protein